MSSTKPDFVNSLNSVYIKIENIESRVGAAALSGGDSSVSSTSSPAGSNRKAFLLSSAYEVPADMDGSLGLYVDWSSLFDATAFEKEYLIEAPESIGSDSLSLAQDPMFLTAYRPYTNTYPSVTLVCTSPSTVAMSLKDNDVKLRGGEVINFSFLLYTGTT